MSGVRTESCDARYGLGVQSNVRAFMGEKSVLKVVRYFAFHRIGGFRIPNNINTECGKIIINADRESLSSFILFVI